MIKRLCTRCGLYFDELRVPSPTVLRKRAWGTCPRCQEQVVPDLYREPLTVGVPLDRSHPDGKVPT